MADEKCQRCGVVGHDRRTLWMACLYEMREIGVPFELLAMRGGLPERHMGRVAAPWGWKDQWSETYRDRDKIDEFDRSIHPFYTLRVCKGCRGAWLDAIKTWFRSPPDEVVRWNNDESCEPSALADLLVKAEELRTEMMVLQQRIDATTASLREESDRRSMLAKPQEPQR